MAYKDKYGVEYSDDGKTLVRYYNDFYGEYNIPEGVERIGKNAFFGGSNLTAISIPNSVRSIEAHAFGGCSELRHVILPVNISKIEEETFWGCKNLEYIFLPESITNIGKSAFFGCKSLINITIPSEVTRIEGWTFCGCSALLKVNLPHNLTIIENSAFSGCSSLSTITIPNSVSIIEDDAFSGCCSLSEINIPHNVSKIGGGVFCDCICLNAINVNECNKYYISLDGVLYDINQKFLIQYPAGKQGVYHVPDTVIKIERVAFGGCSKLTEVILPDKLTIIESGTFAGCSSLAKISIPQGVTRIGNSAFEGCKNLTSILIPGGIKKIEQRTFYSCSNLVSLCIPEGVLDIESDAFADCDCLKEIRIPLGQKARYQQMKGLGGLLDKINEQDYEDGREMVEVKQEGIPLDIISQIESVEVVKRQGEHNAEYDYDDYLALRIKTKKGDVGFMRLYHQSKLKEGDIVDPQTLKAFTFYQEGERILHLDGDILIGRTDLPPKYIFFDTETAGLPRNYYASYRDTDNWPRLVQIAWLLVDKDGNEIKRKSAIIYPEGFSIPQEAINVHGITTERAKREGHPLKDVLDEFMQDLVQAEKIVGHNIDFDRHIVGAELCRLNMPVNNIAYKLPVICTMRSTTNFCAIPSNNGYGGYKWPTLEELYYKVFNHKMLKAHDALADIVATKECFFELKKRGII